jgi:hypothetical protein
MKALAMNDSSLRVPRGSRARLGRRSPGDVMLAGLAVLAVTSMGAMPIATA